MEKKINKNLFNEDIEKIKYRFGYKINETPKYRQLIGIDEEFDELPPPDDMEKNKTGEKGKDLPPIPSDDKPVDAEPPVPAFDDQPKTSVPPPMDGQGMTPSPEVQVDEIQNEIIRHNINAMKGIYDKLESLNSLAQNLSAKMDELKYDVDEVKEPTNAEKLMSKTSVSYPYYFNLNDFWSGNWFNEQREKEMSKGIRELPDGTFIADFDDLPQKSGMEIKKSFNDIV